MLLLISKFDSWIGNE